MATIDEIKQQAEAVKNATQVGENTALRVGGVLVDLCEWMKNLSGTSGGSGVSLGTLLTKLNTENPFPTNNGQVLTYNGSNFIWKAPAASGGTSGGGSGGSLKPLEVLGKDSSTFFAYNGETGYRLRFGSGLSMTLNVDEYVVTADGGSGGSIQVAQTPEYSGGSESWVSATKLRFVGITGTKPTIITNSEKSCVDVGIPVSSGSGSSSRIKKIKLFNSGGSSFETIELGSADTIGFMAGNNVTLEAVVKEYTNVIKISATGGSSGGSGGGSISWSDVTNKPSTFTPSSHTHSTSDINGLSNYVRGITVNNADKAKQLANPRLIWGQSFNGTGDINGNLKMGSAGGGSIQLWMNNGNMLDRTNNTLHIGYGLKESSDGEINLDANVTKIYTDNYSKHYDFKSNVFDVNTNAIHFGSGASGGKISWDAANNAFKIEGNVYTTGGITALGVSNSATTSNNVDFTFKSVTANTFKVIDVIQLSDTLNLNRDGNDLYLASTDVVSPSYIYLDGMYKNYSLDSQGDAHFNSLSCDYLIIPGDVPEVQAVGFQIINVTERTFTIKFDCGDHTYQFTPSEDTVIVI